MHGVFFFNFVFVLVFFLIKVGLLVLLFWSIFGAVLRISG